MPAINHDLNALKSFFLMYKCRSVTSAAKLAGVTQPSMSRTLNKLREEYQDRLFVRQKDQLVPTAKADYLMAELSPLFEQIFAVMEAAEPFQPEIATGAFHFSAPAFISQFAMQNLPTGLLEATPNLEFYYSYWSDDAPERLQNGELDLAFGHLPHCPNHVKQHSIAADNLVLLHRPGLTKSDLTNPKDLLAHSHISLSHSGVMNDSIDRQLAALNIHRHKTVITPDIEAAFKLLMKSDYLLIAPSRLSAYFAPEAIQKDLPIDTPAVEYSLYWGAVKDKDEQHRFIRTNIIKAFEALWPSPDATP